MSVIEVKNLSKSFEKGFFPKKILVLKGINFSVEEGKITGFLGANGSGKTTTMKCMLNLIWPDQGKCLFFGGQKLDAKLKSNIGFLPEHPYFYDFLTGEEFLLFYGKLSGAGYSESDLRSRVNLLLKKMDLTRDRGKKLREYSKGMLQKIGLIQAVLHEPRLLILDEPMSGLDFNGRSYVMEIIHQVSRQGASVFLSSHLLYDVERLCDNLVVLKEGEVIFDGEMNEFMGSSAENVEIIYQDSTTKEQKKQIAENSTQGQNVIDRLRSENKEIISVQKITKNLEETFKDLALKKKPTAHLLDAGGKENR